MIAIPIIGLIAIVKLARSFAIGIIHGVVSGNNRRRAKYGGDFELRPITLMRTSSWPSATVRPKDASFVSSVISIACEQCYVPRTEHDMAINYNDRNSEVEFDELDVKKYFD